MFNASIKVNQPVTVLVNSKKPTWGQIKDVQGKILHTGGLPHITAILAKKYNQRIEELKKQV